MGNVENINSARSLIFFDIETSGFGDEAEILQISAVCKEKEFNVYTKPLSGIDPRATDVNRLSMNINNDLCYDGERVDSECLLDGLEGFTEWIKTFPNPFLIGHNIQTYDCRIIMKALEKHNLKLKFCRLIYRFVDTKKIFKNFIPKNEIQNYQQRTLVLHYLNETYEEHNALADVRILQKLVFHVNIPENIFSSCMVRPRYFSKKISYKKMIAENAITDGMARKFAEKNISYNDLLFHYRISGRDGIKKFLSQTRNKKVIGTKNMNVINKICKYFEDHGIGGH